MAEPVADISPLDLRAKLAQSGIASRVELLRRGAAVSPVAVDLDPTTQCDLACPGCISEPLLGRGGFRSARLLEIADELADAGVLAVVLVGGGEPLMSPAASPLIDRLAALGLRVGLVTNGTQLDRHREAIARGVDWVRISMDAGTKATHDAVRPSRTGRSTWHAILSGIEGLVAQHPRPRVGYSFVTMPSNVGEVLEGYRVAGELGCDYFELKALLDDDHQISSSCLDFRGELEEQIGQIRSANGPELLLNSGMSAVLAGVTDQPKAYSRCLVTAMRTTIGPTGVYVCAYHRGAEPHRVGDAVSEPLGDIFARLMTSRIDPSASCQFHCSRHGLNEGLLDDETAVEIPLTDPFI